MGWAERQADAQLEERERLEECERLVPVLEARIATLEAEVARLTPTWQDGDPPEETAVWREGWLWAPVFIRRVDGRLCYLRPNYNYHPWGSARWAPIARPA